MYRLINHFKYTAAYFLVLIHVSCSKDWLEAKSDQSQSVPETYDNFRAMLDNISLFTASPCLTEIAADYHTVTTSSWNSIKTSAQGNAFTWSFNNPYATVSDWNNSYATLASVNVVINGITKIKGEENHSKINELKGEALFHRGRIFYELAMTFSSPYNSKDEPYGIPLRLSTDIVTATTRATVHETYNQILKDLKEAESLLPLNMSYQTRPTKIAAKVLLARIYLSLEMYDSAYHYANNCLSINNSLLNYDSLPKGANFIGLNSEIYYINYLNRSSTISTFLVTPELLDKYAENDLRKQIFFRKTGDQVIFKGSYSKNISDKFSGVASDEMYLVRAECNARKGNIQAALIDINDLLRSRFTKINGNTTYEDMSFTDPQALLKVIMEEREKELILRNVRWSDLRRLNKDPLFAKTIERTVDGITYTLEPNSYKYTFPIPQEVIDKAAITQNPEWGK